MEKTGLSFGGDPLGLYTLRGRAFDIDLVLENGPQTRPGPSGDSANVTLVRFSAQLADTLVCRASETNAVMGALPSVPRVRTKHGVFDSIYAVFVLRTPSDYRGESPAAVGTWAHEAVVARLMDLGLEWMRAREGTVELALARLNPNDVQRAKTADVQS